MCLIHLSKCPPANIFMHTPPGKNSSVENIQGISGESMGQKNTDLLYTAIKLTQSLREVLAKFLTYLMGLYTLNQCQKNGFKPPHEATDSWPRRGTSRASLLSVLSVTEVTVSKMLGGCVEKHYNKQQPVDQPLHNTSQHNDHKNYWL